MGVVTKAIIYQFDTNSTPAFRNYVSYCDANNIIQFRNFLPLTLAGSGDPGFKAAAETAVAADAVIQGYTLPEGISWAFGLPDTTSSYQAIVSQSGTSAPTGTTRINTYLGSPTFTWARTGTGVYTLTASSAVFDTSGKTGVFVQPLTNLNGAIRAVVTSSTVITVTTAVQSLAVLGLLGFTATNTDSMLDKTMIFVQTYA